MRHVRNRSCGCEVNMLDARSLHTETKGSNSPSPPQTGGPKVDEPRPRLASTLSRISHAHASARALCIARSSARLLDQQREAACMRHKASTGPLARRCRSSCCGQPQKPSPQWRVATLRGKRAAFGTLKRRNAFDWGAPPYGYGRRVNTSRGAVLTRLNTSTAVVLTVNV